MLAQRWQALDADEQVEKQIARRPCDRDARG
jgi:hypothetical protein